MVSRVCYTVGFYITWQLPLCSTARCWCVLTSHLGYVMCNMHSALWAVCVFHVGTCGWWISSARVLVLSLLWYFFWSPSGFATSEIYLFALFSACIQKDKAYWMIKMIKIVARF
jgi:hypothetical protein